MSHFITQYFKNTCIGDWDLKKSVVNHFYFYIKDTLKWSKLFLLKTTGIVGPNTLSSYEGAESFTHHCSCTIRANNEWSMKHAGIFRKIVLILCISWKSLRVPQGPMSHTLWNTTVQNTSFWVYLVLSYFKGFPLLPTAFKSSSYRIWSHDYAIKTCIC